MESICILDGSPPYLELPIPPVKLSPWEGVNVQDLPSIAVAIRDFQRIALQFPDEMIEVAHDVTHELQRLIDLEYLKAVKVDGFKRPTLFILADTACGSCCIDEVAAEHYAAGTSYLSEWHCR